MIDGSPLRGESVEIIVTDGYSYYSRRTKKQPVFRKRFTVPDNGIVDFVVPSEHISQKAKSLTLEVSSDLLVCVYLTNRFHFGVCLFSYR